MEIYKTWTNLKTLFQSKSKIPDLQYDELDTHYRIFVVEAGTEYFTEIWIDTSAVKGIDITQNNLDKVDFETNFKPSANQAVNTDVNVDNDINIGNDINVDATFEDGNVKIFGNPDQSGEPDKGPVTIHEKSGGIFELAIKDEDVLAKLEAGVDVTDSGANSKLSSIYSEALSIKEAIGEKSGTNVIEKLEDIETRYGRYYDAEDDVYRLEVHSKALIFGHPKSGYNGEAVHIINDNDGNNRLAVDANINFQDGAVVQIDNWNDKLWEGYLFEISGIETLQASDEFLILVVVDDDYDLFIDGTLVSELGHELYIYEEPTVTANGTAITPISGNRTLSYTLNTLIYSEPTISAQGTLLRSVLAPGSNQSSVSAENPGFILKAGYSYILKIVSRGNGNDVGYNFFMYERVLA